MLLFGLDQLVIQVVGVEVIVDLRWFDANTAPFLLSECFSWLIVAYTERCCVWLFGLDRVLDGALLDRDVGDQRSSVA